MDLNKLKKTELQTMCKDKGLTKYLKKPKADLIVILVEAGVKNVISDDKSDVKVVKKTTKPRLENINKKLEKFVNIDDYKEELSKYKEDVDDDTLYKIVEDDINNFVKSDTLSKEDYAKVVDKYGAIKLISEYGLKKLLTKCENGSEDKMYKELFTYYYNHHKKDEDNTKNISNLLIKKVRKYVVTLCKPKKETDKSKANKTSKSKPVKKSKKEAEETEEEEDDDSADEDYVPDEDDEEEEDDE